MSPTQELDEKINRMVYEIEAMGHDLIKILHTIQRTPDLIGPDENELDKLFSYKYALESIYEARFDILNAMDFIGGIK